MIALAQKNAKSAKDAEGNILTNVEFHLGTIDRIPVPDQSVDCVISNCVINLAADKNAVFQEIARILKPGGRLAASDLALKQDLPEELAADALAWAACISGAIKLDDYETGLKKAGFHEIAIVDSHADINAYATMPDQVGCCAPPASSTSSGFGLQMIDDTAATSCCGGSSAPTVMHEQFLELVRKYNLNDFAASVKIYAIKKPDTEGLV
jgi:SAM-dependent methyltransferase